MSEPKSVLRRNGFTFKQFFVGHDRCAMKVGTDSVLLGAWAPVSHVEHILDIGTGSGLLALMLAQRTSQNVSIDAVELDACAASQAIENVAASPWDARIQIHQADIVDWTRLQTRRYDLIISNPPYFTQGVECRSFSREQARYTTMLDHHSLLECSAQLITEGGFLCVILPEDIGQRFLQLAEQQGWHCQFRTDVMETEGRQPHRVLLGLSPSPGEFFNDSLAIRGADQRYSDAYCSLTRDFYLFM